MIQTVAKGEDVWISCEYEHFTKIGIFSGLAGLLNFQSILLLDDRGNGGGFRAGDRSWLRIFLRILGRFLDLLNGLVGTRTRHLVGSS